MVHENEDTFKTTQASGLAPVFGEFRLSLASTETRRGTKIPYVPFHCHSRAHQFNVSRV